MPPRVFRDRRLERAFQRDGYVVVPFVDPSVLDELLEVYRTVGSGIDAGYYASVHSSDDGYKATVDREITQRFWPRLDEILLEHEPIIGAFMVKHPGPGSGVPAHQDWICTDERVAGAINCWVPLTELNDEVGGFSVLPGSLRYLDGLRGSPSFPTKFDGLGDRIHEELMVDLEVPRGSAVIYDGRLLHATRPNRSDATRVVAYLNATIAGTPRRHYFRNEDGDIEVYAVADDFHTSFSIGQRPDGQLIETVVGYQAEALSYDEICELQRARRGPLARLRR
jgi:hypothetical protein